MSEQSGQAGQAGQGGNGEQVRFEARPGVAIDPVCGMEVVKEGARWSSEHEGTTYWFCGKGCMLEFGDDPGRFLDPAYQPMGM
jgi:YHS domain-containing protein